MTVNILEDDAYIGIIQSINDYESIVMPRPPSISHTLSQPAQTHLRTSPKHTSYHLQIPRHK
ncbi:MAG: hypothetical protein NXY57DRAFT_969808 [Lentinula lateritia]|nr:MAG: hypothetical protein NXY57DRAFT_969808 [Lentinula lateritia]